MSRIFFPLLNTIILGITIFVNYLSTTGMLYGKTVGTVSDKYQTLLTPAGYAFGIWGFIYLSLIAFAGYQWYVWKKKTHTEVLIQTGYWLALANVFNTLWILAWIHEDLGLSVILIFGLLLSLIVVIHRLRMELWDAPVQIIAFVWWPICWYFGWIILASILNVASFLVSTGWSGEPLNPSTWAIIMIFAGVIIYNTLTFTRNMRELSLIGAWGLLAIAVKQWGLFPAISWSAIIAIILILAPAIYHGRKNRLTGPFQKLKRGEI